MSLAGHSQPAGQAQAAGQGRANTPLPALTFGAAWTEGRTARLRSLGNTLDNPLVPAAAAIAGATAFVLLRLHQVARDDVMRFIYAGRKFVNPARAPKGLVVYPGTGYDGQFYYRLALDPANLSRTAFGITLDSFFRVERIGYPVLAWLAAGGRDSLVPDSLIGVNIAALGVLAWFGALLARDSGRHAAWGLLVAGYFGFLFSLGRDLPEIVASAFLVAGLLNLRHRRPVLAGLLFAGAVLSIETTLDVVIGVAIVSLFEVATQRRRAGRHDWAWIIPGVGFVAWQAVGKVVTGTLPLSANAQANLGVPLVHMFGAIGHYASEMPSEHAAVWLGQFVVLATVVIGAAWSIRRTTIPDWERAAWVVSVLVVLSLSEALWFGKADFRGFEDAYLLSSIVLLGSRRRLWVVAALVLVAWGTTFAHRVYHL